MTAIALPSAARGAEEFAQNERLAHLRTLAPSVVDHPSGYVALSAGNEFFAPDRAQGFIAYREQGRHFVLFGGVHAPPACRERVLDGFLDFARSRRRRVIAVQIRENQLPLFRSRGFVVNALGASFAVTLRGYTLAGTKKMKLRNKIKRARGAGLVVREVGRELPRTASTFARLREISAEWLAAKGKKELEFMIGEIGERQDLERRIFVVSNAADELQAFISYVPVWGGRPGVLHDLTRKTPDAGVGALELCNAFALERFVAEGVPYLHFGFTPFIVDEQPPATASRLLHWLVLQLRRHGQVIYPSDSQASYKLKWGPDIIEQEYVAARPLSWRAVIDLLMLTRAV
jgi:lysylphosphatidylglycerol synthetase-like protein (DUF2156 family)